MFKWEKLGKIFDPRDYENQTWMHEYAQSPSAVIFDEYIRVYFCSRPAPSADGQYLSFIAYVDLDRKDLRKIVKICDQPVIGLGKLGTFDEFGTNPVSVIRHGEELRAYFGGWTRCESVRFNAAIGIAISRDGGETFSRLGDGPVIPYSPDEPFLMGSPRIRKYGGKWRLWYVAGKEWVTTDGGPEPLYKIRMASSEDGINWEKYGKDLIEDKIGPHECQACPDVISRGGKYHMFFSYRNTQNYKSKEGGYRTAYAVSDDMFHWTRHDEMAGLTVSESGWDGELANYPNVFAVDGETYLLYQGNGMGRTGFGLARLADTSVAWGEE